ncbi:MAG: hypothetical protein JEZ06_23550 [Anaerolineaceae bacterium]|nr:hypothetical protein [Anaerolineaceae bacterium]
MEFGEAPWDAAMEIMIDFGHENVVLTAPKRALKHEFEKHLDGIKKLRDAGIADLE